MEYICRLERFRKSTGALDDGASYRFDFIAVHPEILKEYCITVETICTPD